MTTPFVSACGVCPECRAGDQQVCRAQTQPGFSHWGSFAGYVVVHHADHNLVPLPDTLDDAAAASLGCRFVTAFRAVVDQGEVRAGQWVAVHGCGGVGLSAVMIAAAAGARVIAVDIDEGALALARSLGAVVTIDAGDSPHTCRGRGGGLGRWGARVARRGRAARYLRGLGGEPASTWTPRAGGAAARRAGAAADPHGPGRGARAADPRQPWDAGPPLRRDAGPDHLGPARSVEAAGPDYLARGSDRRP